MLSLFLNLELKYSHGFVACLSRVFSGEAPLCVTFNWPEPVLSPQETNAGLTGPKINTLNCAYSSIHLLLSGSLSSPALS